MRSLAREFCTDLLGGFAFAVVALVIAVLLSAVFGHTERQWHDFFIGVWIGAACLWGHKEQSEKQSAPRAIADEGK